MNLNQKEKNHIQNTKLIQWNLNGFQKKINELKILIAEHSSDLICLQETNFTDQTYKTLRNYICYTKNRTNGLRASGGVAIYVKPFFSSKQINVKIHLEAIAISIQLNAINLNVCNLYLPNQTKIELSDIENIIKQLPKPFMILGDFNAHCTMWGSEKTDYRGKIIEKILENENIVILNDTSPTHINLANGNLSCIDLTMCTSSLAQRLKWKVLPDIYSSDHLPILTNYMDIIEEEIIKIQHNDQSNIENTVKILTNIITSAAEISIGSCINHNKNPKVPWWNDEIKRAIFNKKSALNTKNKILSKEQSGFRHTRSTMDNLIIIKTEIENAFEHKQILGMISLDITKAYDSVWRYRILTLLSKILTNGNMFMYITNFLKERQFQVKVSHTLSKTFCQENGIPQGSSLAVTLFLLAINDIDETIKVPVKANLFADDFNIFYRSNNLKTVQELLQISANSLSDWSKKTGFSFSNLKSQSIIFTKQKKTKALKIILDNLVIPHYNKIKILGITFYSKLNWISHLKNIRDSISQKLNIINIIAHTSWGGDSSSLLMIYKALIRSKTDYGSILFKNAKTNHLNMVHTKLNTAIRLSIGGFKSSPIESIRNIANEIAPNLRREKLLLLYCAKTKRNINNPAIKAINAYIQEAEKENIKINNILERKPYNFPPWNTTFNVNLTLTKFKKENTMPFIYKNMLNNILQSIQTAYTYTLMHPKLMTESVSQ
ncbi:hypothetical protein QTP88_021709 [Uroleucon formosanum]